MIRIKRLVVPAALWLAVALVSDGFGAQPRAVAPPRQNGLAAVPLPGRGDRAGTEAGLAGNRLRTGAPIPRRPVVVVPIYHSYPYYYYSYHPYFVPSVVINAPFFCVLHQDGYVSRVGMLDHLAGTHKFPLDTAAAICPDGSPECIFPGY